MQDNVHIMNINKEYSLLNDNTTSINNEIICDFLIDADKKNYKCYSELKRLLEENQEFKQTIISGLIDGKIRGFDQELWEKIRLQNIRRIRSFEQVFIDGANIGYCTVASKQLSYSLNDCYLCGGILPILKGSKNCDDGSHTWILCNNEVIDTALMLIIDGDYITRIGYVEENRYNPNMDPIYSSAKEFANDTSIRKSGGIKK